MKKKWIGFLLSVAVIFCLYAVSSMAATVSGNVVSCIDICAFSGDSTYYGGTDKNVGKDNGATFHGNSGLHIYGWYAFNKNWSNINPDSVSLVMYDENGQVHAWGASSVNKNPGDAAGILSAANHYFSLEYGGGTNAGTCRDFARFTFRISDFDSLAQKGIIKPGKKYSFHIDVYDVAGRGVRLYDKMFTSTSTDRTSNEYHSFFATYRPIYYNSVSLKLGGTEYNDPKKRSFNEIDKKIRVEGWATTTEGSIYESHLVIQERQDDNSMKEVRRIKLPTNTNPGDAAAIKGHGGQGQNAVRIDYTYAWVSGDGTELSNGREYLIFVDMWYHPGEGGDRVFRTAWRSEFEHLSGNDTCNKGNGWYVNYERPVRFHLDYPTTTGVHSVYSFDTWHDTYYADGTQHPDGALLEDGTMKIEGWALSRAGYKLVDISARFVRYHDADGDGKYDGSHDEAWDTGWLSLSDGSNLMFYDPNPYLDKSKFVAGGWVEVCVCPNCGYRTYTISEFTKSGSNLTCPSCKKASAESATKKTMDQVYKSEGWEIDPTYKHRFRFQINPYKLIDVSLTEHYTDEYTFDVYFKPVFRHPDGTIQTYGTRMGDINSRIITACKCVHMFFNGDCAIGPTLETRDHWHNYGTFYIKETGHYLVKTDYRNINNKGTFIWKVNTKWDGSGTDLTNDYKTNSKYNKYKEAVSHRFSGHETIAKADNKVTNEEVKSWADSSVYSTNRFYPVIESNSFYIESGARTNAHNTDIDRGKGDPYKGLTETVKNTVMAHEDKTYYSSIYADMTKAFGFSQTTLDSLLSREAQTRLNYLSTRSNLTGISRIQCTWDNRGFDTYFGDLYDVALYKDADWGKRELNAMFLHEKNPASDTYYGRFVTGIADNAVKARTLNAQAQYETRMAFEGYVSAIDLADGPHMFQFIFTEDWGGGRYRTINGNQNKIYIVHKDENYILDVGEVGSSPFGDNKIWYVDENGRWSVDVWRAWRLADESLPMEKRALSYYIKKIHITNYYYENDNDKTNVRRTHVMTNDYDRVAALYGEKFYNHSENLAWKVPYNTSTFYIKRPIKKSENKAEYAKLEDRLSSRGKDPDANNQETFFTYVVPSELLSEEIPSGTVFSATCEYMAYGDDDRIFSEDDPLKGSYGTLRRGTLTLRFTVNHDFEIKIDNTSADPELNQPFEGWFQYVDLTIRNNKHIHYNKYRFDIATKAEKNAGTYGQTTPVTITETVGSTTVTKVNELLSFDGGGFDTSTKKPNNAIPAIASIWRADYGQAGSAGNHPGLKLTYEPNPDPNLEAEHTLRFIVNGDHMDKETNKKNNVIEKVFKARTFYEFKLGNKFDEDIVDENGNVWSDENKDGAKDEEDIYARNEATQIMGDINGDGVLDSAFIRAEETGNGYLFLDFYARNAVTQKVVKTWLKNGKTATFTVPLSVYVTQGSTTVELYSQGYREYDTSRMTFTQAMASSLKAGAEITFTPNQIRRQQMLLKMPDSFVNSGQPFTLKVVLNEKASTGNKGKNYQHEVIPTNNEETEKIGYDFSISMSKPTVNDASQLTEDAHGYIYHANAYESLKLNLTLKNKDARNYKNVPYEILQVAMDGEGNIEFDVNGNPVVERIMKKGTLNFAAGETKSLEISLGSSNLIRHNAFVARVNYGDVNSLYGYYNAQRERLTTDNVTKYMRVIVARDANFWIDAITPTDLATGKTTKYTAGETVISAYKIYSDAGFDLENAVVTFEVYKSGSRQVNLEKKLSIPNHAVTGANAQGADAYNIAYFSWTVPSGWVGSNIECRATVQAEEAKYFDNDTSDNTDSFIVGVVHKMSDSGRTPEETEYAANKSNLDLTGTLPAAAQGTATWKEYTIKWNADQTEHSWDVKTYSIKLDVENTLGAQTGASNYVENGKVYMRSGYAFSQTMKYTPSSSISGDRYVAPQLAYTLFPEFAYSKQANYTGLFEDVWKTYNLKNFRVLQADGTRTYKFKNNAEATNATNKRVHFIPLAFPDGEYKIFTKLTHAWTPVGMLSTSKVESINVKGSMYDDYSVGRKSQSGN